VALTTLSSATTTICKVFHSLSRITSRTMVRVRDQVAT